MAQNCPKNVPKMVSNVQANGPNEARNTNTTLPDLQWHEIAKKLPRNGQNYHKMAKNYPKWAKMAKNGAQNGLKCLGK